MLTPLIFLFFILFLFISTNRLNEEHRADENEVKN